MKVQLYDKERVERLNAVLEIGYAGNSDSELSELTIDILHYALAKDVKFQEIFRNAQDEYMKQQVKAREA